VTDEDQQRDSMNFSAELRRQSGRGEQEAEKPSPEPKPAPDFGAGARPVAQPEPDMNELLRQARWS
jgi:hypothetical protein